MKEISKYSKCKFTNNVVSPYLNSLIDLFFYLNVINKVTFKNEFSKEHNLIKLISIFNNIFDVEKIFEIKNQTKNLNNLKKIFKNILELENN